MLTNNKIKIGLIIAMDKELLPYISNAPYIIEKSGGKEFYLFDLNGTECVAVKSGIGKVNASYATTLLIKEYNPKVIISTGISGGLGRKKVLDIVVAKSCVQYDVDTTALGDELGFVSTVNKIYFETDEKISEMIAKSLGADRVVLACGDKFVADKTLSEKIVEHFDASACDMESGAIAQIAYITETPFVAIRCISDGADDDAPVSFDALTDSASEKLYNAICSVVRNI